MNLNNSHQSPVSYLHKAVLLSLMLLSVTPFSRQRMSRMKLHARLNICLLYERSRLLSLHSDAKSFQFIWRRSVASLPGSIKCLIIIKAPPQPRRILNVTGMSQSQCSRWRT